MYFTCIKMLRAQAGLLHFCFLRTSFWDAISIDLWWPQTQIESAKIYPRLLLRDKYQTKTAGGNTDSAR